MNFPFMPQNGILIAYERFVVLKITDMIQKLGVIILMIAAILCGYGIFALVFINGLVGFVLSLEFILNNCIMRSFIYLCIKIMQNEIRQD